MPCLAYIIDMYVRTNGTYGVTEGILSSAIAALTFSLFSVQPLTIVGITGLINLFNYTTYDILSNYDVDYLQFMAWTLMYARPARTLVSATDSHALIQLGRHHALDYRRLKHLRLHSLRHRHDQRDLRPVYVLVIPRCGDPSS